jgi:hypothetical protein
VNRAYLAIVGVLTALMLFIFLVTDQPLDLTFTAVVLTGGLALGAAYIYSRDEAYEEAGEGAWSEHDVGPDDEPLGDNGALRDESPAPDSDEVPSETEDDISSPS